MHSYIQFITTPTADTPGTTLILHFDSKRYLVGSLAEGTQRACVQMGTRLLKVSEAFISGRNEWSNTGGMIGMILTLADSAASSKAASTEEALRKVKARAKRLGISEEDRDKMQELEAEAIKDAKCGLNIFGPRNLNYTLATARRYVFRRSLPVDVHEIRDELDDERKTTENEEEWAPYWADENVKVWAMSVSPASARPQVQREKSQSISPRKRSIDEVNSENGISDVKELSLSFKKEKYLKEKSVVSAMFNSTWNLDTLHETKLRDVKLPATIFIRNPDTKKTERYSGPLPGSSESLENPDLTVLVRRPWPGALIETLPDTQPCPDAVSYIFKNHKQRGKFLPNKAMEHKVKKGPYWQNLAAGYDVLNEDGETITPDMVLGPSKIGGGVAVMDLPTVDYIEPLLQKPEWRVPEVMEGVGAVVWICGRNVASDQRVHAFMKEFKHLEHLVSSPDYCSNYIALDGAATSTIRLKQLDPDRYGVPVHDMETSDGLQQYGGTSRPFEVRKEMPLPEGVLIAARGQQVQLEPIIAVKNEQVVPALDIAKVLADMPQAVMEEATKAQQAAKVVDGDMQKWLDSLPQDGGDTEIITLGTGSALPSKYRNVSATLVRVPNWGNALLDSGENTIGQLRRVFTESELKQIFQDLRMIFISHMHADHQLGTTSIIKTWYQEVHDGKPAAALSDEVAPSTTIIPQRRLAIVSEPAMQQWLAEYSAVEDFGYSHLAPLSISPRSFNANGQPSLLTWFTPATGFKDSKHRQGSPTAAAAANKAIPASALDLSSIEAVAVRHCHGARAVSITFPSGVKISYSGDCRPSRDFARIGRGSTVCIHEATFDDELQGDANAKNHSTTSEALGVAQAMRARACVLTHFSQRYQKVPVLERAEDGVDPVTAEKELDSSTQVEEEEDEIVDLPNGRTSPTTATDPENGFHDGSEAQTLPDQTVTGEGRKYDLPTSSSSKRASTHSQPKATEALKFKLTSDMKVCVAFDYMRIKVKDVGHMEKFTPALLKLFEQQQEDEETGEKVEGNGDGGNGKGNGNGNGKKKQEGKKKGSKRNN